MPRIVAIAHRAQATPWVKEEFLKELQRLSSTGIVAIVDNQIVGTLIYSLGGTAIKIVYIAIEPTCKNRQVVFEQFIRKLKNVLYIRNRACITTDHAEISEQYEDTLKVNGFTKSNDGTAFTFSSSNGDRCDDYHRDIIDNYKTDGRALEHNVFGNDHRSSETCASDDHTHMPRSVLLSRARNKLAEITLMEWEIVRATANGNLRTTRDECAGEEAEEVFLRTCGKVCNPRIALMAVGEFLGRKLPHSVTNASRSGNLLIPATWIRQIHLERGYPGQLADSFRPADYKARYKGR